MKLTVAGAALVAAMAIFPAAAQQVAVTEQDCKQLVAHYPRPDVNYTPGVDVYGRKVAPADLPSSGGITPSQTYTFDVNADLRKYGLGPNSPLSLPSVGIGRITIEDQGRQVYFNGQPLGDTEQRALAEACRQQGLRR